MKINKYMWFLLLAASFRSLPAQVITRLDGSKIAVSEIDKTVQKMMEAAQVQGVNLAILQQNKIAYVQSYGYKNKPQNSLMDTATIVYAASFSKAVFGYLVMKLVEENHLVLDTPLSHYLKKPLPEYEYYSDLRNDDRWKLITPRMCLSHTTGLPNVRWFHPITGEMDTLGVMRLYFKPGEKYAYSGEGFKLLQLAIEETMGKKIDEVAQEKIFKPLGMHRTGYIWHDRFGDDNVAVGHLNNGLIDVKKKRKEAVAGGSLVTTIADYARFIEHVMQQKGLAGRLYQEMLAPQIAIHSVTQFPPITSATTTQNDGIGLSYGLGWGVFHCSYGHAFFKEGNGESWRNYNINFADKGLSIIILCNSENGESIFQELVETVTADNCIPWQWHGYVPYHKGDK